MFQNPPRRQRGMMMVYVAMALIPLVGLFVLAMQWAQLTVVQAALQDYVDARAISAIKDRFGSPTSPVDLAAFVSDQVDPLTEAQCGGWVHDTREFNSTSECRRSSGVPAHRVEHSITVPILFAPFAALVGSSPEAELTASATAFIPRRQVVLVQDISGSLGDLGPSQDALGRVVDTMYAQDLPGDEVGVVSFGSDAVVETSPLSLASDKPDLDTTISNLTANAEGRRSSTCTSGGIALGRETLQPLEAEHEESPLMIIVTDGVPSTNCDGNRDDPTDVAVDQAEAACADQIDVWVIPVEDGWGGEPNLEVIRDLACDPTQVLPTTTASAVQDAVVDILTRIPVRIVE